MNTTTTKISRTVCLVQETSSIVIPGMVTTKSSTLWICSGTWIRWIRWR